MTSDQKIQRDLFRIIVSGWSNQQLVDYINLGKKLNESDDEIVLAELDRRGQL